MKKNNLINNWLNENGSLEIEMLVKRNLAIASKVRDLLKEKEMTLSDLAEKLGKTQPEISKWLSGSQNLTQKSIIKMEIALGETLIYVEQIHKYVYLGKIEGTMKQSIDKYSEENYSSEMPAYAS